MQGLSFAITINDSIEIIESHVGDDCGVKMPESLFQLEWCFPGLSKGYLIVKYSTNQERIWVSEDKFGNLSRESPRVKVRSFRVLAREVRRRSEGEHRLNNLAWVDRVRGDVGALTLVIPWSNRRRTFHRTLMHASTALRRVRRHKVLAAKVNRLVFSYAVHRFATPHLASMKCTATGSRTPPAPVRLDLVFGVSGCAQRHSLPNICGQMCLAASLKFGECCAFSSTKHSTASMLISDGTEKQNLFNAVWDGRNSGRNWQEVLCHLVLPVGRTGKDGACEA